MILLNLLAVSIGIGLLVTLLLVEVFGLAAGGLVVPGYFALKLLQPWNMAITLLASYLTFITVRALASFRSEERRVGKEGRVRDGANQVIVKRIYRKVKLRR